MQGTPLVRPFVKIGTKNEKLSIICIQFFFLFFIIHRIVIVIIGILIAALLPRLQGAQAMARDTARQTALTTIGTAIAAYQLQLGYRPGSSGSHHQVNSDGTIQTNAIETVLKGAGIITEVPKDRNLSNSVFGLGGANSSTVVASGGNFAYLVLKKNAIDDGGFVLMARTEMPGSSNRVVANSGTSLEDGYISTNTDMRNITTCTQLTLNEGGNDAGVYSGGDTCIYNSPSELRYIYMY